MARRRHHEPKFSIGDALALLAGVLVIGGVLYSFVFKPAPPIVSEPVVSVPLTWPEGVGPTRDLVCCGTWPETVYPPEPEIATPLPPVTVSPPEPGAGLEPKPSPPTRKPYTPTPNPYHPPEHNPLVPHKEWGLPKLQ